MDYREITKDYLKRYGEMFRNARLAANRTQKEIADTICCSSCVISFIENGYMLPPDHIENGLLLALGKHIRSEHSETIPPRITYRCQRVESITPYGYSNLSKRLKRYAREFKSKDRTIPRVSYEPDYQTGFEDGFIKAFELLADVCERTALDSAKRVKRYE